MRIQTFSRKVPLTLITGLLLLLGGCANNTVAPTYTSTQTDVLQIGGDKPSDPTTEFVNAGSYCLEVTDTWKENGQTPDKQTIWTKDTQRQVAPCK